MTAKRKRGSLAARLEDLEVKRAELLEEVRAENWAAMRDALAMLSAADRVAERDALGILERDEDPAFLERVYRACDWMPDSALDVADPAKEEAEAWAEAWAETPEGAYFPAPSADRLAAFVAYFEQMAVRCDEEARRVPLSLDVQRVARWGAAMWRFEARLGEVLAKRRAA